MNENNQNIDSGIDGTAEASLEVIEKVCPECGTIYPITDEICHHDYSELVFKYPEQIPCGEHDDSSIDTSDNISPEDIPTGATSNESLSEAELEFLPDDYKMEDSCDDIHVDSSYDNGYSNDVFVELGIQPTNNNEYCESQPVFDNDNGNHNDSKTSARETPQPSQNHQDENFSNENQSPFINEHHVIPRQLLDQGYRYSSRLSNAHLYDDILVCNPLGNLELLRTYHTGTLSTDSALHQIQDKGFGLIAYGMDNLNSFSKDWELLDYEESKISLRDVMPDLRNNTEDVLELAYHLTLLINRLPNEISPISLEVEFLKLADDVLRWDFFGAFHAEESENQEPHGNAQGIYLPKLEISTTIANIYRAPELEEGMLYSNSVVFSIGQIIAEAYFGQPLSPSSIREGDIPFTSIVDDKLRALLMGCLYPHHSDRWQIAEIVNLFEHDEVASFGSWASLRQGASQLCIIIGSASNAIECWSPMDLANAIIPERWDECIAMAEDMLTWLEKTHEKSLATQLKQSLQNDEISRDFVLVKLKRTLTPNVPIIWREFSLSANDVEQSLTALAQRALSGDEIANKRLQQLHDSKLVTIEYNAIDVI